MIPAEIVLQAISLIYLLGKVIYFISDAPDSRMVSAQKNDQHSESPSVNPKSLIDIINADHQLNYVIPQPQQLIKPNLEINLNSA